LDAAIFVQRVPYQLCSFSALRSSHCVVYDGPYLPLICDL
jgi:hypothetical protein